MNFMSFEGIYFASCWWKKFRQNFFHFLQFFCNWVHFVNKITWLADYLTIYSYTDVILYLKVSKLPTAINSASRKGSECENRANYQKTKHQWWIKLIQLDFNNGERYYFHRYFYCSKMLREEGLVLMWPRISKRYEEKQPQHMETAPLIFKREPVHSPQRIPQWILSVKE